MPGSRRTSMIDGYTSVQIARRAAERAETAGKPHPAQAPGTSPPAVEEPEDSLKKARIGRTAVPARFDILCYECAYAFVITGHLRDTVCPRCHKKLEMSNPTISDEFTGICRTIGTFHLRPSGRIRQASITARILVIEGDATDGALQCQQLQLLGGSRLSLTRTAFQELLIPETANLVLDEPVRCQKVDVRGILHACVHADTVTIRTGASVIGEIHAAHLIVEECAGLKANLFIGRDRNSEKTSQTSESESEAGQPAPARRTRKGRTR